ncbi:MAG TPA: ABC transporter family substrate-binding protein [Pseudonocardiaceae bacterium]|nr:ABC transporter family substrate-binding protein [Pseudonocardiaceae bacterium]
MRRSRAYSAMALLAGGAVALSGCGSSGSGGGSGATNNGPSNADPQALALSQPYVRPKVPDMGAIAVSVDETFTNYNNNLAATNNLANVYIDNLVQPGTFFTNDVKNVSKVQLDGDLMSSVKVVTQDPQVIEYNVKPQAVWSDGAPVNCADFYLQWLAGAVDTGDVANAFQNVIPGLDHISGIKCSNNNKTVTVTFSKKWADWQGLFGGFVPAHILTKAIGITDDQLTKLDDNSAADKTTLLKVADFYSGGTNSDHGFAGINLANDLSAGPYVIQSADGKNDTVLVRNPKWWGNAAGPAKIDVRTNRDDQSAYQQLQNKEIQVAGGQADAQVAQEVKASGGQFKLITGIGVTFEHLDFQAANPVFKKYPELRKAFSDCVNRQDIITKVVADVDPDIKPLGMVLFLPTESSYQNHYANTGSGDEVAAKQVLTAAGWTAGSNGYMQKNGQTATITIGHKTNARRTATVQAIQAQCKTAGIQVQDFTSDGFNGKNLPAGDYQVALFAWTGSPFKSGFDSIYQTKQGSVGGANYQGYSNPKVDALFQQADGELNYAKRTQDLQQADQLIAQDGFTLPLFTLPEYGVTDGTVKAKAQDGSTEDLADNEASSGILWNAYAWMKA